MKQARKLEAESQLEYLGSQYRRSRFGSSDPPRTALCMLLGMSGSMMVLLGFQYSIHAPSIMDLATSNVIGSDVSLSKKSAGNASFAGDLYGLGVRLGIYLQSLGLWLGSFRAGDETTGPPSIAIMVGILVSWTIIATRHAFSPAEAVVILWLASIGGISSGPLLFAEVATIIGVVSKIILWMISFWSYAIGMWFWATLYAHLPWDGTYNVVWLFTTIRIDHWFRIFSLVTLGSFPVCVFVTWAISKSRKDATEKGDLGWSFVAEKLGVLFFLVFFIIMVEKTITSNDLQPQSAMSSPGQSIPLSIGAVVLFLSISDLFGAGDDG